MPAFGLSTRSGRCGGEDLPYLGRERPAHGLGGLEQGFDFEGERVPFFNPQKGIFTARAQRGNAALSVMTSANSPYDDAETDEGFLYAYRDGALDLPDNRALRAAHRSAVPITYFIGTRPGWFMALYPCFVVDRDDVMRRVLIAPPSNWSTAVPHEEAGSLAPGDPVERRYATRTTVQRLHQGRFRGRVLPAYRNRCTVCRLREAQLLDAAHITPDADPSGTMEVSNGLSLCSIHHRAFDGDLVGISPDYEVVVSRRLREEEDGPMLELLKGFHGMRIDVPRRMGDRPDRDRLAARLERLDH